jgi:hypothetical protein
MGKDIILEYCNPNEKTYNELEQELADLRKRAEVLAKDSEDFYELIGLVKWLFPYITFHGEPKDYMPFRKKWLALKQAMKEA